MKRILAMAMAIGAAAALQAEDATPVWELGKSQIDQAGVKGEIKFADGVLKLDCSNSFEIPASVLGEQKDYTIELEFKRGEGFKSLDRMQGALRLISNLDEKAHKGLALVYFPPAWDMNGGINNAVGIDVNGYWNAECGGLDGLGFNKYSVVVKDKLMSIYRNGMLLAMTGEVAPSPLPLTFGGKGWRGTALPSESLDKTPVPVPYEFRAIKIYDKAIAPEGFDKSLAVMRNVCGENYTMQRVDVKDPKLPRILVIGDSISMGYRSMVTERFKGKAYVDYWVGGTWFGGDALKDGDKAPAKIAWKGVLSNGPYDVISWNAMTLHMWTPKDKGRCPEESIIPNFSNMVEFIKVEAPDAKLVWVRCTPLTKAGENGEMVFNPEALRHEKYNALVDEVMRKYGVPEVDLWEIAMKNLDKASKDGVHWSNDASKLFADAVCAEIEKNLPAEHREK